MIQDDHGGYADNGQNLNWWQWTMDPVPAGDTVVCFYKHDASGITTTFSDDQSNTWTNQTEVTDSANVPTIVVGAIVALKITHANMSVITMTMSAHTVNVWFSCSVFYHVGAVNAVKTGGPAAGPTVSTAATTALANDAIIQMAFDDGVSSGASPTVGTGYSLLPSNTGIGNVRQFITGVSAGSTTPTITLNGDFWDTIAVDLTYDVTQGSDYSTTMKVRCETRHQLTTSPDTHRAPCPVGSPNLIVTGSSTDAAILTLSYADSNGNSYTSIPTTGCPAPANNYPQVFYAQNASVGSSNTRTMTITHNGGAPGNLMTLFVEGASPTQAFDKKVCAAAQNQSAAGNPTGNGTCSAGAGIATTVSITPSTANGMVIAWENNGIGPECRVSANVGTAIADMTWFRDTSAEPSTTADQSDTTADMEASSGFTHLYNASTSAITFTWSWANLTATDGVNLAVAFESPSTAHLCTISTMGAGSC